MNTFTRQIFAFTQRGGLALALSLVSTFSALAAVTDIANVPVIGGGGASVKPNIMLLMDTSNSMSWTHMPDQLEVEGAKQSIGYKSNQCNSLYYNPNQTYRRPKDASNAFLPMPSFTAARYNYYVDATTVTNLSTEFQAHDAKTVRSIVLTLPDTPQAAYYYVYTGTATNFSYAASPCNVSDTLAPNTTGTKSATGGTWRRVLVSATSGIPGRLDERENFAIWYTYYRTRMGLAKSAIGSAFAPLNDSYRVGFINGNPTIVGTGTSTTPSTQVQANRYEKIADFDATQKINWFSKLYGQYPAGSSPTREALARVGRHYAGKNTGINQGMPEDPVQQACQPNFTILTTDGYWNTEAEKSGVGGGPTNIGGTAWVGQQDSPWTPDTGLAPYGVYDGTNSQIGYTEKSVTTTRYSDEYCNRTVSGKFTRTVVKKQFQWQKTVTTAAPANTTLTQQMTSQISKRTWNSSQTTSQWRQPATTTTMTTSQNNWYNPTLEQTMPVASCAGLSGCTTTATGPTTVAAGSCTELIPTAPEFKTVHCTTSTVDQAVPSCSAAGCYQVNTGPTPVRGDQCWTANPSYPDYKTYVCTVTNDTTSFVSTCSGNIYAASGNQTCTSTNSGWSTVSSCTSSGGAYVGTNLIKTDCRTVSVCVPTTGNNCAASAVTTVGGSCTAVSGTTCTLIQTSGPTVVDPATCTNDPTPSAANGWIGTTCTNQDTAPVVAATCTPTPASAPLWEETLCTGSVSVAGSRRKKIPTTVTTRTYENGTVVGPTTTTGSTVYVTGCVDPATVTALPTDEVVNNPDVVVTSSVNGGSINSLADVAQYYYKTDLRPTMADLVRPAGTGWGDDRASWQHMTTFVVGLGVSGTLNYREDYATATTGDFAAVRAGTLGWPQWPDPTLNYASNAQLYNSPKSIDDFWHTAVNGRGKYFSANNPDSVVSGIRGALASIDAAVGAGTSVAISDPKGVTIGGLNYTSNYVTGRWVGDVEARPSDGSNTLFWSAKAKLATQTQQACDDRRIYVRNTLSPNSLGDFTWDTTKCTGGTVSNDLAAAHRVWFVPTGLNQYTDMTDGSLSTVNQVAQATGASLVNYIRGQRQNEGFAPGVSGKLYRTRDNVLGDIINSKPLYVGAPYLDYVDAGYSTFKSAQAARKAMLYVGANDGMLHAFYAPDTTASASLLASAGKEAWAYIPTTVIPNLTKLADNTYGNNHRYFVDGTPASGDVQSAGVWRSILVGGLNAGGKGFYALDITDPETPKSLWEFDATSCAGCDVGLSFGKPIIAKLKNGTWVVILTSGYNNSTGKGILFVLDAVTGTVIRSMNTGAGTAASPSGLAQVSAWTDYPGINDTAARVYGGDLLGNIWRFDINDVLPPAGFDIKLIGVAKDASGNLQPITTAPELGSFKKRPYVYVGTGRLLGVSDLPNTQQHTVYGIYDDLNSNTTIPSLRAVLKPYRTQSDYTLGCTASTSSCNADNTSGWFADLAVTKEQVNLPLTLIGTTLVITTSEPQDGSCAVGGVTRVYFASGDTGKTAGTGLLLSTNGVVGVTFVNVPGSNGGADSVQGYARDVTGTSLTPFTVPTNPPPPGSTRTSWREVNQQ